MGRKNDFLNIEQQRLSTGKRVKEFCEARGISPSLYYYWRKKQLDQKESKFELIQVSSIRPGSGMRILYPNGVQVELYGEVNLAQLSILIDVGF